jgi:hypothetical protein
MGASVQHFFLYLLALGAGVSVATQQVLNGSLRTALGSPAWAGLISYANRRWDDAGYDRQQLLGRPLTDLVATARRQALDGG